MFKNDQKVESFTLIELVGVGRTEVLENHFRPTIETNLDCVYVNADCTVGLIVKVYTKG